MNEYRAFDELFIIAVEHVSALERAAAAGNDDSWPEFIAAWRLAIARAERAAIVIVIEATQDATLRNAAHSACRALDYLQRRGDSALGHWGSQIVIRRWVVHRELSTFVRVDDAFANEITSEVIQIMRY